MLEELISILKQAFESGIITSSVQTKIDAIKAIANLSDAEYNEIEDHIRLDAYLSKVNEREKKGESFIGDLRKQYKITEDDKIIIQEKLKWVTKQDPKIDESDTNNKTELPNDEDPVKGSEAVKDSVSPIQEALPTQSEYLYIAIHHEQTRPLVLVADDNESFLIVTKKIIENNGFECITSNSAETTIRIIIEKKPALVICDINFGIGKSTGMDVFNNIRSRDNQVPFIIVSAFIQQEFKDHAKKIGITDYITKPIDQDQLIAIIKKYVHTT